MDRWQAQYQFWAGFGVPAYEENSVPSWAKMPYITYQAMVGGFGDVMTVTASIWDKSTSWEFADTLADRIENAIRLSLPIAYDDGMYRVYIGNTPFSQNMGDPEDDQVKRKILNVNFEFMDKIY